MAKSNRQEKFLQLRTGYPFFIFEQQEYSLNETGLSVRFTFNLAGKHFFHPTLFFPRREYLRAGSIDPAMLKSIIFNIGMVELVSYWKAACPPKVIIRPFALDRDQVEWWKRLYFSGLGEFFYLNSIQTEEADFMHLEAGSGVPFPSGRFSTNDMVLVPVGGGKDSAVTLELLRNYPGMIPMMINPSRAGLNSVAAAGIPETELIEVRRTIDPELLKLNGSDFLNGHTPFSALVAFVSVLAALLSGRRYIALSNESSASEVTIPGTSVNHQYSKSLEFERRFREYINRYVTQDVNYFSFLRPLSELQIAGLFSSFQAHHAVFRSCNAGSRTGTWCGRCPKCLFTWIILAPFMQEQKLVGIFGKNLLDVKLGGSAKQTDERTAMKEIFDQLTGLADEKPFECVGTIREVNIALCEVIRQSKTGSLSWLLDHYRNSPNFPRYCGLDFSDEMRRISGEHFLPAAFQEILQKAIHG